MDDREEQSLIDSAQRGDDHAVRELLERHLSGVRAFVRLRMAPQLRAKESASDLVQSVCLELLRNLSRYRYRSDDNFKRWLYTTALRKLSNKVVHYRRERRDVRREQSVESLANEYRSFSTPSHAMMDREEIEQIERVFDTLPADYREVITLTRIVGLSHQEVAAMMGRTQTATRSLLVRALGTLTKALQTLDS
jgi:RNA polymerase sigma-70 factor, ECF subfamily